MKKKIKVSFHATVEDKDLEIIKSDFQKYGSSIINEEFEELEDIGEFEVEIEEDQ